MKKTFKRLGAMFLAMVMAVSVLCTGSFAADDETKYTITINGKSAGHTYEAYRVFKGTVTEITSTDETQNTGNTQKKKYSLANIEWDDSVVNTETIISALQEEDKLKTTPKGSATPTSDFANCETAADVANVLSTNDAYTGHDAVKTQAFATVVEKNLLANATEGTKSGDVVPYTVNVPAGYYLIKDNDNSQDNKADTAATRYILEIVGPQTVETKDSVPTLEKEVKSAENTWGKVNDNQIGDTVEFRVKTTVPDITGYTNYTYEITDTMSEGLTSNVKNVDDITIKVNDTTELISQYYYTVTVDTDNPNKFTVKVDIKKAIDAKVMKSGDTLYTYYSGVLNKKADSSDETSKNNTNTASLKYSNDPNGNGTGTTTEKKVYDWTFKIELDKVDKTSKTTLKDAKFVLSKNSGLTGLTEDNVTSNENLITFTKTTGSEGTKDLYTIDPSGTEKIITAGDINIKGLDADTTYYLYEITAPEGYNKLTEPVEFKISAAYNDDGSALQTGKPTISVDNGTDTTELKVTVENSSGNLPSTGGMGTKLFYTIGGLLMAGAAIVLVIKKRRSSAE